MFLMTLQFVTVWICLNSGLKFQMLQKHEVSTSVWVFSFMVPSWPHLPLMLMGSFSIIIVISPEKILKKRRTDKLTLILLHKLFGLATKGLNITTLTHLNLTDRSCNYTIIHAQKLYEMIYLGRKLLDPEALCPWS